MVLVVIPVGREVGMEEPMEGVSKVRGIGSRGDTCTVRFRQSGQWGCLDWCMCECGCMCACGRKNLTSSLGVFVLPYSSSAVRFLPEGGDNDVLLHWSEESCWVCEIA